MADDPKKILIGEDEKPLAQVLTLKLKKAGFDARAVTNGQEVLDALAQERFDLVLLDLVMPKVDGFGVLEELKKRGDTTKVIVLSNLSQEEDAKKAKELGAQDFFIKSNTPIADIVEKVASLFG